MSVISTILQVILLIVVVVTVFNIIIFVHELGHFWAAKWRGLQIDRFQIWFGKPIWKKEINGVQYGLGWIPVGGFVALPQMAPMEALEGGINRAASRCRRSARWTRSSSPSPVRCFPCCWPWSPRSCVWQVGKPADFIPTTEIGFVVPDSPAAKAGLRVGDKITAINGVPVHGFAGSLDSITERIILSRGEQITYTVERPGEAQPVTLTSGFETEKSRWFQRRGLRQVGIEPAGPAIIGEVIPNSPAAEAGLWQGRPSAPHRWPASSTAMPSFPSTCASRSGKPCGWKSAPRRVARARSSSRPNARCNPPDADPMVGIRLRSQRRGRCAHRLSANRSNRSRTACA